MSQKSSPLDNLATECFGHVHEVWRIELEREERREALALLREIRDRLAGLRPLIHVPTVAECERYGGGK